MSVTLRREIREDGNGIRLMAHIGDLHLHRPRRHIDTRAISEISAVASLILAVDAERLVRRMSERGVAPDVTTCVGADDDGRSVPAALRDGVLATLDGRVIAIEPKGIPALITIIAG